MNDKVEQYLQDLEEQKETSSSATSKKGIVWRPELWEPVNISVDLTPRPYYGPNEIPPIILPSEEERRKSEEYMREHYDEIRNKNKDAIKWNPELFELPYMGPLYRDVYDAKGRKIGVVYINGFGKPEYDYGYAYATPYTSTSINQKLKQIEETAKAMGYEEYTRRLLQIKLPYGPHGAYSREK